jgi:hypothetical protein
VILRRFQARGLGPRETMQQLFVGGSHHGRIQSSSAQPRPRPSWSRSGQRSEGGRPHRKFSGAADGYKRGHARPDMHTETPAPMTTEMALRLGTFFGNGPELWLGLQADYDIWQARQKLAGDLAKIKTPPRRH